MKRSATTPQLASRGSQSGVWCEKETAVSICGLSQPGCTAWIPVSRPCLHACGGRARPLVRHTWSGVRSPQARRTGAGLVTGTPPRPTAMAKASQRRGKYSSDEIGWMEACLREEKARNEWKWKYGWQGDVDDFGRPRLKTQRFSEERLKRYGAEPVCCMTWRDAGLGQLSPTHVCQ